MFLTFESLTKLSSILIAGERIGRLNDIYFIARSLIDKADELRILINTWEYEMIAITEMWLKREQGRQQHRSLSCDPAGNKRECIAILRKETITVMRKGFNLEILHGNGCFGPC